MKNPEEVDNAQLVDWLRSEGILDELVESLTRPPAQIMTDNHDT